MTGEVDTNEQGRLAAEQSSEAEPVVPKLPICASMYMLTVPICILMAFSLFAMSAIQIYEFVSVQSVANDMKYVGFGEADAAALEGTRVIIADELHAAKPIYDEQFGFTIDATVAKRYVDECRHLTGNICADEEWAIDSLGTVLSAETMLGGMLVSKDLFSLSELSKDYRHLSEKEAAAREIKLKNGSVAYQKVLGARGTPVLKRIHYAVHPDISDGTSVTLAAIVKNGNLEPLPEFVFYVPMSLGIERRDEYLGVMRTVQIVIFAASFVLGMVFFWALRHICKKRRARKQALETWNNWKEEVVRMQNMQARLGSHETERTTQENDPWREVGFPEAESAQQILAKRLQSGEVIEDNDDDDFGASLADVHDQKKSASLKKAASSILRDKEKSERDAKEPSLKKKYTFGREYTKRLDKK